MKSSILLVVLLLLSCQSEAIDSLRVLFVGNSYTAYNSLTQTLKSMAANDGKYLYIQEISPGGTTFKGHSSNTATMHTIATGNWDYVVLQEQSQMPAFPDNQVESDVYPYARKLDSTVSAQHACAQTIFYMTWGRKNGDASNCGNFPPLCTYLGMDSLLQLRYAAMADDNGALLAPVAKVWRYIRGHYPAMELYNTDESHPSAMGSFAAALTFYTLIYKKDPTLMTYNGTIGPAQAAQLKQAARAVVFDSLQYWTVHETERTDTVGFTYTNNGAEFTFQANRNALSQAWDFGNGAGAQGNTAIHTFLTTGLQEVCLQSIFECDTVKECRNIWVVTTALEEPVFSNTVNIYPNPASTGIHIAAAFPGDTYNKVSLSLKNQLGQILIQKDVRIQDNRLSYLFPLPEGLGNGIYFLQINSGAFNIIRQLLISK